MIRFYPLFFVLLVSLLFGSCASSEKFALLQNAPVTSENKTADFQATLQPDDLLMIIISAENPIIAQPYNLTSVAVTTNSYF